MQDFAIWALIIWSPHTKALNHDVGRRLNETYSSGIEAYGHGIEHVTYW